MSVLNSTPALDALLALIGITAEEELFANKFEKDSPLGIVNMLVWRAFNDYRDGEKSFGQAAARLTTEAASQIESTVKGCTPTASWLTHYAAEAATADAAMKHAVNQLHSSVAIRNALLAVA